MQQIMTTHIKKFSYIAIAFVLLLSACKPQEDVKPDLGLTPTVSASDYSLSKIDENHLEFKYLKSENVPLVLVNGKAYTNYIDTIILGSKGTYNLVYKVYNKAGISNDSIVQPVVITKDLFNMWGEADKKIEKVWILYPGAGTLMVGPNAGDGSWFTSTAGDVTTRSCAFNDTYTFKNTPTNNFVFDDKGDFWYEKEIGNPNAAGCAESSSYPTHQATWGSGTFSYELTAVGGVKGKGQITVTGKGAHIGLQRNSNGADVTEPVSSVTYDIWSLDLNVTEGTKTYDKLVITINVGYGWWTYTLVSYK